jgi:hypothetical protein
MLRRIATSALFLSPILVASSCGGSTTDKGGFTSADRAAAQVVLDSLQQTSIPTTLVVFTNTAGTVPVACRIHLESKNPPRYTLFILWRPSMRAVGGTYTWFRATLGRDAAQDTFASGYVPRRVRQSRVLSSQRRDAFARPNEPCEILMNGYLRLLSRA